MLPSSTEDIVAPNGIGVMVSLRNVGINLWMQFTIFVWNKICHKITLITIFSIVRLRNVTVQLQ